LGKIAKRIYWISEKLEMKAQVTTQEQFYIFSLNNKEKSTNSMENK